MLSITLQRFIDEHRDDDVRQLALQADRYPDVDMRAALVQISGWQKARVKLPSWAKTPGIVYSEKISLEQCSSEATADYKLALARRRCPVNHERLADLTGGLAVDGSALARHFGHYVYIEQQEWLCEIARHNLPLLGVADFEVMQGRCEDYLPSLPYQDMIYADPARRDDAGRKVVGLQDCTPDVTLLLDALLRKCDFLLLKLSPMLDMRIARDELRRVVEEHVVAVDGECKELLMVMQGYRLPEIAPLRVYSVNIKGDGSKEVFSFLPDEEKSASFLIADGIGEYLYEPNAAVMKGGGYKLLARTYGVGQLDVNTHLYTSDQLVGDFPGRQFSVVDVTTFSKKALKTFLSGMGQCNLSVRNFPSTVAELRKRYHLKDGGEDYVFATTVKGEKMLVRCRKVS